MKRWITPALVVLILWPLTARAEHARIDLSVHRLDPDVAEGDNEGTASADREPPTGGFNPRPTFKVKAHEPLALQFILTNLYPHGEHKGVKVRYVVVREKKAGQKEVPALTEGVVTQGLFRMNFKPKCRVGARVRFTLPEHGVYLLRVETLNTGSDHEHFSAIDLVAE
jgi:hypothetical protein